MHEGLFFIEKLIALAINHTGIVFIYALWVIMTSMKNKKGKKSWLHVYAWLIHSTFEFSFLKMKNVFYHCNITKSYYYSCCEKIIFILIFFHLHFQFAMTQTVCNFEISKREISLYRIFKCYNLLFQLCPNTI